MPRPPDRPTPETFVRFLRAVEGHVVARYGTGTQIGARRDVPPLPTDPEALAQLAARARVAGQGGAHPWVWDLEEVVPITAAEEALHGAVYDAHIKRGELKAAKATDWKTWLEAEAKKEAGVKPE